MLPLRYTQVDVFSATPYSGNSLPVFHDIDGLTADQMLRITRELRHFEAIFLGPVSPSGTVRARIFDLFEELPFAGHPLIGAAAVRHEATPGRAERTVRFELADRTVSVNTRSTGDGYFGTLDQGRPEFHGSVADPAPFARALSLAVDDLEPTLPLEVVSTGLRYLVVPVRPGALERAAIRVDIGAALHAVHAQFAVLLDEAGRQIRHWNNDGVVEDVATGSAAGVIGAYLLRHGRVQGGETFVLHQGRFAGRPSTMHVAAAGTPAVAGAVTVGGDVTVVGHGNLVRLP